MSRTIFTTALALVLASVASAQSVWLGNQAYCGTGGYIVANGPYLSLFSNPSSSSSSAGCKRLYRYAVNPGTGSMNMTFNELDSESCWTSGSNSPSRGMVSWATYNPVSDNIRIAFVSTLGSDTPYETTMSPGACDSSMNTATSSAPGAGSYCGTNNAAMTTYGQSTLVRTWSLSGQECVESGTINVDSTGSLTTDTAYYGCRTSVVRYQYTQGTTDSTLAVELSGWSQLLQFQKCSAPAVNTTTPNLVNGKTYCASSTDSSADWQGASFQFVNETSFVVTSPQNGAGSSTSCWRFGNYTIRGTMVSLYFTGGDDTCSSNDDIVQMNYNPATMTFSFATQRYSYSSTYKTYTAGVCTNTANVPAGSYCASTNASMWVGGGSLVIRTDGNAWMPVCYMSAILTAADGVNGSPVGGYLSGIRSTCSMSSYSGNGYSVTLTNTSGTVFVSLRRGSSAGPIYEGYAFRQDNCMWPVSTIQSARYCNKLGDSGADSVMAIENGNFMWTLNNSFVSNSYRGVCAWAGRLMRRGNDVSYHIDMSDCDYSSPPTFSLRTMTVNSAGGLNFVYSNSSYNTSVVTANCSAQTSYFTAPQYCPVENNQNGMIGTRLMMQGMFAYELSWGQNCLAVYQQLNKTGTTVSVKPIINNCLSSSSNPRNVELLSNGEIYGSSAYNPRIGGGSLSPEACMPNYNLTGNGTAASFCGMLENSKISIGFAPNTAANMGPLSAMSLVIEQLNRTSSDCKLMGGAILQPSSTYSFGGSYSSSACSNYKIRMMTKTATGLSLTIQYLNYEPQTVALGECTAWSTGVTSGAYCGAAGMSFPATAFGSYLSFISLRSRTFYIVNVSSVASTNVSTAESWYWYMSSGGSSGSTWTGVPSDLYINTVAPSGMTISEGTTYGSMAYNTGACFGSPMNALKTPLALASAEFAALGGRIFAAFDGVGHFAMRFNGTLAADRACFVAGSYYVLPGGQVTLMTTTRNTNNCGSTFEFSAVQVNNKNDVSFNLNYKNTSTFVTLTANSCGPMAGGVPAGVTCASPTEKTYMCNSEWMNMAYPTGTVSGWGNVTVAANQTIVVQSDATNMPFSLVQKWSLASYNASSQTITNWDYSGRWLMYKSPMQCMAQTGNNAWIAPFEGSYCGTFETYNTTLVVLPGGNFYMSYTPKQAASTTTSTVRPSECMQTGTLMWNPATGAVVMSILQSSDGYSGGSYSGASGSNCYWSQGSWSEQQPKTRFTEIWFNNKTMSFKFAGNAWTSATATPSGIAMMFNAGSCSNRISLTVKANQLPVPEGFYTVAGAWTTSRFVVVGDLWVYYVQQGMASAASFGAGKYNMPRRTLTNTLATYTQDLQVNFDAGMLIYTNINNYLFNVSRTGTQLNVLGRTPGQFVTSPYMYEGVGPAGSVVQAAAEAKKEEEKKKTVVIVVVIVVVVLVLLIVGVVVMKSKSGGGNAAANQPGGQDYRPMNSV